MELIALVLAAFSLCASGVSVFYAMKANHHARLVREILDADMVADFPGFILTSGK